jgi:hypothetical protein
LAARAKSCLSSEGYFAVAADKSVILLKTAKVSVPREAQRTDQPLPVGLPAPGAAADRPRDVLEELRDELQRVGPTDDLGRPVGFGRALPLK